MRLRLYPAACGVSQVRCYHLGRTHSQGTGGSSLHAAIALCKTVDVYGAGLFSEGVSADKRYAHYYDRHGIAACAAKQNKRPAGHGKLSAATPPTLAVDTTLAEIYMHVLHELGIVRWIRGERLPDGKRKVN